MSAIKYAFFGVIMAGTLQGSDGNQPAAAAAAGAGANAKTDTNPTESNVQNVEMVQIPLEVFEHFQQRMVLDQHEQKLKANVLQTAAEVGVKYMVPTSRLKRSISGTDLSSYCKDKHGAVEHLVNCLCYYTRHGIFVGNGRVVTYGCTAVANHIDNLEAQLAEKDKQIRDLNAKLSAAHVPAAQAQVTQNALKRPIPMKMG